MFGCNTHSKPLESVRETHKSTRSGGRHLHCICQGRVLDWMKTCFIAEDDVYDQSHMRTNLTTCFTPHNYCPRPFSWNHRNDVAACPHTPDHFSSHKAIQPNPTHEQLRPAKQDRNKSPTEQQQHASMTHHTTTVPFQLRCDRQSLRRHPASPTSRLYTPHSASASTS